MDTIANQDGQVGSRATASIQCHCLDADADPVHRLCLAGLTVLPIPGVDKMTDIFGQAERHHAQLTDGSSTQDTLIYRNATTAHVNALTAHIYAVRTKASADHLDDLYSRANNDGSRAELDTARTEAHAKYLKALDSLQDSNPRAAICATSKYHGAIIRAQYPGLLTFFGDQSGLLFFKMSSEATRSAQHSLQQDVAFWARQMDLPLISWSPKEDEHRDPPPQEKQTEVSVRPLIRVAKNHFPTMVIEGGNSSISLHLEKDWWFNNSSPDQPQGDVKIVALVKVDRPAKSITIELWDRYNPQFPSQTVTITPHPEESLSTDNSFDDSRWVVEGAPLVIPFECVFLQAKQEGETDFTMAEAAFVTMARTCWKVDRSWGS